MRLNSGLKSPEPELVERRGAYYRRLRDAAAAPLWERLHNLVPRSPASDAKPVLWDYDNKLRALLFEAGSLISAEEAERRVLILENPGLPDASSATRTLYAGLQLVLPGEVARAHRHLQSALRFILEGDGAHTVVDGEKAPMQPGDLILTPSGSWHDHGNETSAPIVWLDGLDIPIVSFFEAGFSEPANSLTQDMHRPVGDSIARFGENLAPLDDRATPASPLIHYKYERSRAALLTYARGCPADERRGYKMKYVNPATGGHVTPTMGAFLQHLPAGFSSAVSRQTDAAVYVVTEGAGEVRIDDAVFKWKPRDVFVTPAWASVRWTAREDAVLFSFSDRPAQEALGLWREQAGAEPSDRWMR